MRRKKFLRIPIVDLPRDAHAELAYIQILDCADAGFLGANPVPETLDAFADAGDRAQPGNDNASSVHAVTVFARASTYSFIQRKVLLATLPMKKSPMIGSMIGASTGI